MEPAEITFEVPGDPVPQPRPRISTWGGRGRAYVPAGHAIHAYRQAVALVARTAGWAAGPSAGPVLVEIDFWVQRPPSHLTKSVKGPAAVRKTAPRWPRADVDNLAKAVLDAVTDSGAFWGDDDQVVELVVRKAYAVPGAAGRTIVTVRALAHA